MAIVNLPNSHKDFLLAISDERIRQEELKAQGKFKASCSDKDEFIFYHMCDTMSLIKTHLSQQKTVANAYRLAVLSEEFGEVAKLIMETLIDSSRYNVHELRKELIQVAAVCAAWFEATED